MLLKVCCRELHELFVTDLAVVVKVCLSYYCVVIVCAEHVEQVWVCLEDAFELSLSDRSVLVFVEELEHFVDLLLLQIYGRS